jgi:hypothetical protein
MFCPPSASITATSTKWDEFRAKTGATFNSTTRLFEYPRLEHYLKVDGKVIDPAENYHAGLAKLLIGQVLIHHTGLTPAQRGELNLHSVSLRALIIKNQQRKAGTGQLLGWTTDADLTVNPGSLMNTENTAVNALPSRRAPSRCTAPVRRRCRLRPRATTS